MVLKMAKLIEVWKWQAAPTVNPNDIKTDVRALRDILLSHGATWVSLYSGSYGDDDRSWIVTIEHASSEAWGKYHDKQREWQATPEAQKMFSSLKVNPPISWVGTGLLVEETI